MAPRIGSNVGMSMSVSTASELSQSQFTEDNNNTNQLSRSQLDNDNMEQSIAVTSMELDDPKQMSTSAIRAELAYYGLTDHTIHIQGDKTKLEEALRTARLNNSEKKDSIPSMYQPYEPVNRKDNISPQHHLEETAAKVGIRNSNINNEEQSNNNTQAIRKKRPDSYTNGLTPTHIPLTFENTIPTQILTIIRTSSDPSMKSINLDYKSLGNNEVIKLSQALESNTTVKHLSIRKCNISDMAIVALCKMLCVNTTLTQLHLDENLITTEGAAELSTALITNETLTVLTLNDNIHLLDKGLVYLIGALEHNVTLRTLDVLNCGIDENDSRSSRGGNRLEQLNKILESRQIDANFESLLERLLDDDYRVTGIDLSGRKIGNVGAERLAHALSDNTQVRQLWLRGCNLSNGGAIALASCLEQNMTIVDLFLGNNTIGDDGLIAFADALAMSNQTLVSLELDDNDCGSEGFNAFMRGLEENTSVLVASFENNPGITEDMCKLLEDTLSEKRNNLNLVSFIVDPNAGDSYHGSHASQNSAANKSGVVNMSVCSSYMPSTYRRAGFASKDGQNPSKTSRNSGSYKYSAYNRANSRGSKSGHSPGVPPSAQQQHVPPPPPPRSHNNYSSKVSMASGSQQDSRGGMMVGGDGINPNSDYSSPDKQKHDNRANVPRSSGSRGSRGSRSSRGGGSKFMIPVPIKSQALDPIQEGGSGTMSNCSSLSSTVGTGKHRVRSVVKDSVKSGALEVRQQDKDLRRSQGSAAFDEEVIPMPQAIVPKEDTMEIQPLVERNMKRVGPSVVSAATTDIGPDNDVHTMATSVKDPQTQRNFNATLKKLWRRVEMMKRTNHFASQHYKARHFWFWFVPISTSIFMSIVLSLATAIDVSGGSRVGLALFTGFFAAVAFGLNFLQTKFGWSSRAEVHRSAEVELGQVAFRLDTLSKYEGQGLTSGSHSTRSRANAIRDLYRIDVYLQAMQRCTPPIPESINEVFYLLASRLKGICLKYPNAVKVRAFYEEEEPDSENPVPIDMQIDALDLLGREIENYWLFPLFLPNARDVVSRTIDIFFARPQVHPQEHHHPHHDEGIDNGSYYEEQQSHMV